MPFTFSQMQQQSNRLYPPEMAKFFIKSKENLFTLAFFGTVQIASIL